MSGVEKKPPASPGPMPAPAAAADSSSSGAAVPGSSTGPAGSGAQAQATTPGKVEGKEDQPDQPVEQDSEHDDPKGKQTQYAYM